MREVLTLFEDRDWTILQIPDISLEDEELPEYCLCLPNDKELIVALLRRGIATYGLPWRCLHIVWLLDRPVAVRKVFRHLTPKFAYERLHEWKNEKTPSIPLSRILDEILRPLVSLGYLSREDIRAIAAFAKGCRDHDLIEGEITGRIHDRLKRYLDG
jgi:hypothetical protein